MTAPSDETIRTLSWQLIEQALPVRDVLPLLGALASVWHSATDAEVVVGLWDGETLHTVRRRRNEQETFSQSRLPSWDETALATPHCADEDSNQAACSASTRAFVVEGAAVGGVAVGGSITFSEALEKLVVLSAKLAAQWRAFDRELRDRKLEALAEFAAGAGHEINNPLATIAGRAALLLRTESDPERRRSLETIGGQAYRVRDMIGDAMTFARPPAPQPTSICPLAEIRGTLPAFAARFEQAGITLQIVGDEALVLSADREQFRVFVSCLLRNELEALSNGGSFSIEIERASRTDRDVLRLTLRDNGPGLTACDREHLFDPFYSGRPAGRGLGFGLSKCWRIVRLHGGDIDAGGDSESGFWLQADWPLSSQ